MIYYAEDDRAIRELVIYSLKNTGLEAVGFENGAELMAAVSDKLPTLVLLDIMLPGEDGISILKKLRENAYTRKLPVIMVTAKDSEYDKVIGLDCGADDYISKPFGIMEMISRIKAVLRRYEKTEDEGVLIVGDLTVDEKKHSVSAGGSEVELTLKEYELLKILMKNAGIVLTRDTLLEKIWGYDFDGETRTVDVHVRTLRSKLGDFGNAIETVRGVGYRISPVK